MSEEAAAAAPAKEEVAAAEEKPAVAEPAPAAEKSKKKRSRKQKDESEKEEKSEEPEAKKSKKKEAKKPVSNLARKKADPRYEQNGKGRYVSKKKSENGKRNVQARAIKCGRDLLKLDGQMVLLGRGKKGEHLLTLTRKVRQMLKDGLGDEEAREKVKEEAVKMLEEIQAEEKA